MYHSRPSKRCVPPMTLQALCTTHDPRTPPSASTQVAQGKIVSQCCTHEPHDSSLARHSMGVMHLGFSVRARVVVCVMQHNLRVGVCIRTHGQVGVDLHAPAFWGGCTQGCTKKLKAHSKEHAAEGAHKPLTLD